MAKALTDYRTQVRTLSDTVNSTNKPTNSELDVFINFGGRRLFNKIVAKYEDYYEKETSTLLNITASQDYTSVPNDFYKLTSLYYKDSNGIYTKLLRYDDYDKEGYEYGNNTITNYKLLKYRLTGAKIKWHPLPSTSESEVIFMRYIPVYTEMSGDTDTMPAGTPPDFEYYIVLQAAKMVHLMRRKDTRAIDYMIKQFEDEVMELTENRDANEPHEIIDVYSRPYRGYPGPYYNGYLAGYWGY